MAGSQGNSRRSNAPENRELLMLGGNVMIFGLIINLAVGLLLIVFGVLIGKKRNKRCPFYMITTIKT